MTTAGFDFSRFHCACGHAAAEHASSRAHGLHAATYGVCLARGCGCARFASIAPPARVFDPPLVALSLTQPWATLVVTGAKAVETRSWRTPVRGRVGIHASKAFPRWAVALCHTEPFRTALARAGVLSPADLPTGALIGAATLTECFPLDGVEAQALSDTERAFGDYNPGRWGFRLADPERLPEPELLGGALGFWDIEKARVAQRAREVAAA